MWEDRYKNQVALLLRILPEIHAFKEFALHGGTAINLFHRDMPRLSVDIDLTYIPIESRPMDLERITHSLGQIREQILYKVPGIQVTKPTALPTANKLVCSIGTVKVKIEVNTINRGLISPPKQFPLCERAQESFDQYCEIQIVSNGQLYGGKIVAALDRQHPRDLFDIHQMLNHIGYTKEIQLGFLFFLLCSSRPVNELLKPHKQDQSTVLENQFLGMTTEAFSYDDFLETRETLLALIASNFSYEMKKFIVDFHTGYPDWSIFDFEKFPAIQWKLQNIRSLKREKPKKYKIIQQKVEETLLSL